MDNKSKMFYGSIELISSLTGLVLNVIALPYFLSRREKFSNILYILIVVTDIFTCVVGIPSALSFLIGSYPVLSEVQWLCTLTGIIFNITSRFSIFLIAALSVCRTITLIFVFRKMNQSVIGSITIAIYFILLLFQAFLPILFSEKGYLYDHQMGTCTWTIEWLNFVNDHGSPTWEGLSYAFIIVPILIPGAVVLTSGVITVWKLLKSYQANQSLGKSSLTQTKRATITVMMVTMLYTLFNVPCWVYFIIGMYIDKRVSWLESAARLHMYYFTAKLSVELNASCNPFVYILRMKVFDINSITRLVRVRNAIQQKVRMFANYVTSYARPSPNIVSDNVCIHSNNVRCDNITEI